MSGISVNIRKTGTARLRRMAACLQALTLLIFLASPAIAGMVSGMVSCNGRPLPGARIQMRDSRGNVFTAITDRSGRYAVNLPPGLYKVTKGVNDRRVTRSVASRQQVLILQSSPQPSTQNLNFRR